MADFQNTIDLLGDEAVTKALVEKTITEFNDDIIKTVGQYAFYKCTALTSADFPNAKSIGQYSFNGCTSLTSVNTPLATSVGNYAFDSCSQLTSISLPSVTNVGNYAFFGCSQLTSINLPLVTSVGNNAFQYCSRLSCAIFRAETVCALSNTSAFDNTPFASGKSGGTLLAPSAQVESYKTATNWSVVIAWNENNRVLALEDYTVDGTITGEIDWDKLAT